MSTVKQLAEQMSAQMEYRVREGSDEGTYHLKTGAPSWMRDIVMAAHGDMMPSDHRYELVASAVEAISDADDPEELRHEWADGQVDTYNTDRVKWLGENLWNGSYCDDAAREFGPANDIYDAIGQGQFMEANEVYGIILHELEQLAEEDEEDEEAV